MASGYHSKAQVKKYLTELSSKTNRDFQRACFELLQQIWPDIRYAKDLRMFDRAGIDLYVPHPTSDNLAIAIQVKGFEVFQFCKSQLNQCIESINKFLQSDFLAHNYLLIINCRFIEDSALRADLHERVKEIERRKKAKKADLLDLQRFLNLFFDNLSEILIKRIELQNKNHLELYEETMGSGVYISDVPFTAEGYGSNGEKQTAKINPLQHVSNYLEKRIKLVQIRPGRHLGKLWTVVVSEFGFGKTSLLLGLSKELKLRGFEALYVPIALIPPDGFTSEKGFIRCLLRIIFEQSEEIDIDLPQLWDVSLQDILRSKQHFVLLLDGLDEHRDAYSHEGLRQIMNTVRELARHVIISVRKEFWDERSGSIEAALGTNERNRKILQLVEWSDKTIASYIIEAVRRSKTKNASRLDALLSLVTEGKYEEFYGDIPRRPLFLEMLVQDVITGEIKKRTVAQLYENYLWQKMERDIVSPFSQTIYPMRPSPSDKIDLYDLQQRFQRMLEIIAIKAVIDVGNNEPVRLMEKFPEEWIKEAAIAAKLPADSVLPYLMRTILVPVGKRTRKHTQLDIRFAHKSFQEYFLARYLSADFQGNKQSVSLSTLTPRYPKGVVAFLESILKTPQV